MRGSLNAAALALIRKPGPELASAQDPRVRDTGRALPSLRCVDQLNRPPVADIRGRAPNRLSIEDCLKRLYADEVRVTGESGGSPPWSANANAARLGTI